MDPLKFWTMFDCSIYKLDKFSFKKEKKKSDKLYGIYQLDL